MASRLLFQCFCLMFLLACISKADSSKSLFNVMKYGAIADGKTDDSKAILTAWNQACQSPGGGVILIPRGTFLVFPVNFKGKCNGPIKFLIRGTLIASTDKKFSIDMETWILFEELENLFIGGGGSLNGQGPSAWGYNTCQKSLDCKKLPDSLRFFSVTNASISHINLINGKHFHLSINSCENIKLDKIRIVAPGDSPNTDGIHIGSSTNVEISSSIISTGDDCISMAPGSKNIDINNVQCGPGHGISIGSLGKYPNEEDVSGVVVRNCNLTGTTNGLRIKTWAPSPPSNVLNITFDQIRMRSVYNPIIIDQKYCPSGNCPGKGSSQVQIRDVKFRDVSGTSSVKVAVNLMCSQSTPCHEIELKDINLAYAGGD
ncbi:hypothetical protein UlMin_037342 [Ulmus minor]